MSVSPSWVWQGQHRCLPLNWLTEMDTCEAMGPYRGGQAQYLRVPYADFNALKLPPGTKNEADFIVCTREISSDKSAWHD